MKSEVKQDELFRAVAQWLALQLKAAQEGLAG